MILSRYINRQVWAVSLVVTLVLAVLLLGGRFIKYLSYAAEGRITASAVFDLIIYRSPEFFQMILPLGFFIGLLLSIGRMSLERELSVCEAAGVSLTRIGFMLLPTFCVLAAIVAGLSLYLSPWGNGKTDILFQEQRQRSDFETLAPGRFHRASNGQKITYSERLNENKTAMQEMFIAEMDGPKPVLVVAEQGRRSVDPLTGVQRLILSDGLRFVVAPGEQGAELIQYESYQMKISNPDLDLVQLPIKGKTTQHLWSKNTLDSMAELHWRLSMPLLAPVVLILALSLSRVNPRQGRFFKLFPAIVIYFIYLGLLVVTQSMIEEQGRRAIPLLWMVHGLFFTLGLALSYWPRLKLKRLNRSLSTRIEHQQG